MLRKKRSDAPRGSEVGEDLVEDWRGESRVEISIVHGVGQVGSTRNVWRAVGAMMTGWGSLADTGVVMPSRVKR